MYKWILLSLLLTGCQAHVGVAFHPVNADEPEYSGANPLGVVRVEKEINDFTVYYEHISSIPEWEEGYGMNMVGINKRIK